MEAEQRYRRILRIKDKHYVALFLAPAIAALILLTIYPMLYSLKISFFNWNLTVPGSQNQFVGLQNYAEILKHGEFWHSLWITICFTFFSVLFCMVIGTSLAFLMFQNLKGASIVRTFVISAMVIAPIIVGTAWRLMYNPGWGLINYFLSVAGIGGRPFLAQASTVLPALIVVDVWEWSPLVMVIVLAGLQGLSPEVYESARVDGASRWQTFIHITLPLLKPALLLSLLIRTMDAFRTFDTIYAMTGGGPGRSSENLNILMYNTAFEYFQVSKAASMALLSLIVITVICTLIFRVFRRNEGEAQ
ncbi:Binding-protein-dependent transport system inner membrane component [Acididesulfobacillus acetoxydans]|uniref:Binding-protein-dependent transport system inner membrane component n=1 Tax=Acididesulfobacillus acetoxydans TaxID=1561005 RepID=A0A8S0X4M5_9FIRM|nr:sugar ABC transporter permease [Acididesulfobacillus acetoxydans]CAA7600910.1 Binding-protein-dependent transport system inner membrane component [Acididesulfobacillus acetoxydans]CEJ08933.1 Permease component of ABC-type sugar transporter [Acididesulfobacillus acetoxydans]